METTKIAEQELKDLLAKYPNLQLDVAFGVIGMSFKEKVVPIQEKPTTTETPVVDAEVVEAPAVDPINPQPTA